MKDVPGMFHSYWQAFSTTVVWVCLGYFTMRTLIWVVMKVWS